MRDFRNPAWLVIARSFEIDEGDAAISGEGAVHVKAVVFNTESPFDVLRLLRAGGGHRKNL